MNKKLLSIICLIVIAAVIWHNSERWRFISELEDMANRPDGITLERYDDSKHVLEERVISRADSEKWLSELPVKWGSLESTYTKCWVPHHRIRFDGKTLEVCFNCDEFWLKGGGRQRQVIPLPWRKALRQLFLDAGIPEEAPGRSEYFNRLKAIIDAEEKKIEMSDETKGKSRDSATQ